MTNGEVGAGGLSGQALSPAFKTSGERKIDSAGETLSRLLTRLRVSGLSVTGWTRSDFWTTGGLKGSETGVGAGSRGPAVRERTTKEAAILRICRQHVPSTIILLYHEKGFTGRGAAPLCH
jgi:hypothetical protein